MNRMKQYLINGLLVVISVLLTILLIELGVRIYTGNFEFVNILEDYSKFAALAKPSHYDELLGWVPTKGVSNHNESGARITIIENGIRSNGAGELPLAANRERPILVVGDSFAFGFEVEDNQTWPAILERLLKRKVINAGVFAYGMDQALLRAKQLIDIYHPDTLIYSFIPDDIYRCQLSARTGTNKPYFDIKNGVLIQRNNPVPRPALDDHGDPGVRRILGYSLLIHRFMMQSKYAGWWLRGDNWKNIEVHSEVIGDEIACSIVKKLDQLADSANIKVYLLAQYARGMKSKGIQRTKKVLDCAKPQWLTVVDMHDHLREIWSRDKQLYRSYFTERQHMTYSGNRFVAKVIEEAMQDAESGLPKLRTPGIER